MEFNWGDMRSLGLFVMFALISIGVISISAPPLPDFLNSGQFFESILYLPENTSGSGPVGMPVETWSLIAATSSNESLLN